MAAEPPQRPPRGRSASLRCLTARCADRGITHHARSALATSLRLFLVLLVLPGLRFFLGLGTPGDLDLGVLFDLGAILPSDRGGHHEVLPAEVALGLRGYNGSEAGVRPLR